MNYRKIRAAVLHPFQSLSLTQNFKAIKAAMPADIAAAHSHCTNHREEILASQICGCFYCLAMFKPVEITEWINEGKCAMCPKCGIDSVLGDKSGYPITREFLSKMYQYWFS